MSAILMGMRFVLDAAGNLYTLQINMKSFKSILTALGALSLFFTPFLTFKVRELTERTELPPAQISVEVSTDGNVQWQKVAAADVIHVVVLDGKLVKVASMPNN